MSRVRHFIIPIMEWLDDSVDGGITFKFGVPSDFGEFYRAFMPIRGEYQGNLYASFKILFAHGRERFDKYHKETGEQSFPIKHIPDIIDLTDVFRDIDFSKKPFFHCDFCRYTTHVNDTLPGRIYIPSFTILYNPS